jgi:hypothetical protein
MYVTMRSLYTTNMAEETTSTSDDKKKLAVTATDLNRVVPKLATKVLLGRAGPNTVLTFIVEMGGGNAQVIETFVIDTSLHQGLIKVLQDNLDKREEKK